MQLFGLQKTKSDVSFFFLVSSHTQYNGRWKEEEEEEEKGY